jgi:1-acyl-sn-glycerol-3-phosphate acyltransferase
MGKLYSLWSLSVFGLLFMLLFPFFLVLIFFPRFQNYAYYINKIWGYGCLILCGLPIQPKFAQALHTGPYIYCANHFSLIDIISFCTAPTPIKFMGKNELANIPLFGYMFRKLHIAVPRSSTKGSYQAFLQAKQAIDDGFSLVIFPEGGIFTKQPPQMVRFKEGAFRLAAEKQIPIVPVSFPDNWIILPDKPWPAMCWKRIRVQFHEPVHVHSLSSEHVQQAKEEVRRKIEIGLSE